MRRLATVLFWSLTAAAVVPLWAFPFIPTQDGPSHLANARVLHGCITDDPAYTAYFDLRPEPLPNWTTQALLWLLMLALPAAIAEKILLTGYVIGFSWSYRRLTLAVDPHGFVIPLLGTVFCYSRCFWMGFYNYCLSMILLFAVLSVLAEQRKLTWMHILLLGYVGLLAYFTHLLGFLLLVAASLLAILFWSESRWLNLGRSLLAFLPGAGLVCWYFLSAGADGRPILASRFSALLSTLFSSRVFDMLEQEALALDTQLEGPLALGTGPTGWCLLAFFLVLFYLTLALVFIQKESNRLAVWPMLAMFVLVTLAYFLGPENLSMEQGGYLKQRFAVLMPLFLGLLLRESRHPAWRWGLLAFFLVVYGLMTLNVWQFFLEQNRELREFTAGRAALGTGRTLFVMQAGTNKGATSDPFLHAADYYCADAANINLDNYQAAVRHFPVVFAPGRRRALGPFAYYPQRDAVPAMLV